MTECLSYLLTVRWRPPEVPYEVAFSSMVTPFINPARRIFGFRILRWGLINTTWSKQWLPLWPLLPIRSLRYLLLLREKCCPKTFISKDGDCLPIPIEGSSLGLSGTHARRCKEVRKNGDWDWVFGLSVKEGSLTLKAVSWVKDFLFQKEWLRRIVEYTNLNTSNLCFKTFKPYPFPGG